MDGVTRSRTPPWGGALILRLTDWTVYNNLRGLEGKGFLHCNYGHCSVEKHTIHWHLHDWEYYIIPIASRDLITTFQSISWRKNPLIRVWCNIYIYIFVWCNINWCVNCYWFFFLKNNYCFRLRNSSIKIFENLQHYLINCYLLTKMLDTYSTHHAQRLKNNESLSCNYKYDIIY